MRVYSQSEKRRNTTEEFIIIIHCILFVHSPDCERTLIYLDALFCIYINSVHILSCMYSLFQYQYLEKVYPEKVSLNTEVH